MIQQKDLTPLMPDSDKNHLISRIDELEKLLAKKKAESQKTPAPKLKVGTDGIPVLVETVVEEDINPDKLQTLSTSDKDGQIINDIINKVDKEITEDLDELIVLLKDSIIDEVKTRLLEELHVNEDNTDKKPE